MIRIDVRGMAEAQSALRNLAAEQLPFAISTAINSTAFAVRGKVQERLQTAFDRPTRLITGATRVEKATKERLQGRVYIHEPRAVILRVHEEGGQRGNQTLERFLKERGWLPGDWRAIPASGMPLDAYGNPRRGEVRKLIQDLTTGISGARGNPRRAFVIPPRGRSRLTPGIYRTKSRAQDRAILPLYLFAPRATYRPTLEFYATAQAEALRVLPDEMTRAVDRAIRTAR